MQEFHKKGLEYAFVKDELPEYADKYGGGVINMTVEIKVITVCGSYRFKKEMSEIAEKLTLEGNCVLTPIELSKSDKESYTEKEALIIDKMHKEKIRLSDAIYVVNIGGYIGKSTRAEIEYARALNKEILYLEA